MVDTDDQRQHRRQHAQQPRHRPLQRRLPVSLDDRRYSQQPIRNDRKHRRHPGIVRYNIDPHTSKTRDKKPQVAPPKGKISTQPGHPGNHQATYRRTRDSRHTPLPALADDLRDKARTHQTGPAKPRQHTRRDLLSQAIEYIDHLRGADHDTRQQTQYSLYIHVDTLFWHRDRDIPVFDRPMIPLQIDRSRLPFMTIQRPARDPRDLRTTDNRLPVEDDRHQSSHQRDIIGLPLPRSFCNLHIRRQEPIYRADHIVRRLGPFRILDLHFIPTPQVYAAVTFLRVPEFDMQLEVHITAIRNDI